MHRRHERRLRGMLNVLFGCPQLFALRPGSHKPVPQVAFKMQRGRLNIGTVVTLIPAISAKITDRVYKRVPQRPWFRSHAKVPYTDRKK